MAHQDEQVIPTRPYPRRTPSIAASYVENLSVVEDAGVEFNPGNDEMMFVEDINRQEESLKALWKSTTAGPQAELIQRMKKLEERLNKSKSPNEKPVTIANSKWQNVLTEVDLAKSRFEDKPDGGPMILSLRKISDNAEVFSGWLKLLPDGDYGATICGIFTLVIGAAHRLSNVRQCIYDTLSSIPETMTSAKNYLVLYKEYGYQPLHKATLDLYLAILSALTGIMDFFRENAIVSFSKSFFQGPKYQAKLVASVADIRRHTESIQEKANQCSQNRILGIDIRSKRIYTGNERMENRLIRLEEELREDRKLEKQEREKDREAMKALLARCDPQEARYRGLVIGQHLYGMLESSPVYDLRTGKIREAFIPTGFPNEENMEEQLQIDFTPSAHATGLNTLPLGELLSVLKYNEGIVEQDLQECLDKGGELNQLSRNRCSTMFRYPQFDNWLKNSNNPSQALLINGADELESMDVISTLSCLFAEFVDLASASGSTIVLSYFCGLHPPSFDNNAGAVRMMQSLIYQLVVSLKQKATLEHQFLAPSDIEKATSDDVTSVCQVFTNILTKIPQDFMIICVLDGISSFEVSELVEDTHSALGSLVQIVRDGHNRVDRVFKLIATCPGWSTTFYEKFRDDERLEIRDEYSMYDSLPYP